MTKKVEKLLRGILKELKQLNKQLRNSAQIPVGWVRDKMIPPQPFTVVYMCSFPESSGTTNPSDSFTITTAGGDHTGEEEDETWYSSVVTDKEIKS